MRMKLFPFQEDALDELNKKINKAHILWSETDPQVISFSAPTGSGKTIMMTALFEDILYGNADHIADPEAIIVWLSDSPMLNEQTRFKIERESDKIKVRDLVTNATLCITGRDVEEKKLKMQMRGVKWEITEELSADDLRKERIPDFVFKVVDFLFEHRQFEGTVTELLAAVGNTELKPNVASKYLTRFYSEVFAPMGITYEYRKTAAARTISLMLNDGADGNDGLSGTERLASLRAKNDGISSLPDSPSQSSFASWEEADDDEELPF